MDPRAMTSRRCDDLTEYVEEEVVAVGCKSNGYDLIMVEREVC